MNIFWRNSVLLVLMLGFLPGTSFSKSRELKFAETPFVDPAVTKQIVEVVPIGIGGFRANLSAWELHGVAWRRVLGPWPVVVGRNGFAKFGVKREGDGRTPSGVFFLGTAFGRQNVLNTGLAYRKLTGDDFWVDDPVSEQYNRWVQGVPKAASYEKMLRNDGLYDVGVTIKYNTDPVVRGQGSAIFMHIWREHGNKSTAGCVAMDEGRLRRLLQWLRTDKKPMVALGTEY